MGRLMVSFDRIYLDANVLIYGFETNTRAAELISTLFSAAERRSPCVFVTSELTLAELLVRPFRDKDAKLEDFYKQLIADSPWLEVPKVTRDVLSGAAAVRAMNKARKLPDAIHVATAIATNCSHLLSADRGISDSDGQSLGFAILRPDEPTLTSLIESLSQ
jgi:predicted nucleic acid-binding protein